MSKMGPEASLARSLTILIAEDDDGHAELITEYLQDVGIFNPIIRFRDGQEAIDYFEKNTVSEGEIGESFLLLLDIKMPRVDGVEVLQYIKDNPSLKSLPVIMLTTTDDPREIETCYRLGCNTYIVKPIDFEHFAETLRRLGLFIQIIRVPNLRK